MPRLPDDIFITYFSGYSAHTVEYNGVLYPTVEHAYHCQRYIDPKIIEKIKTARSPFKAWEVSQKYKSQQVPDFNERKVEILTEINRTKLKQHEDIKKAIIDSGNVPIIKHITTGPKADGFWDDGEDGEGRNEIGKIWMKLREELK